MKVADYSLMIVSYNLVISILLMISSEKIGMFAGHLGGSYKSGLTRLVRISVFTFGAGCAAVSAFVLVAGHILGL